ncbi:hypothetical protein [Campylobacter sp. MG1]|uniref:hypothetical protein n=1 Tax=Campylobacter sp. MG1 TaxID=2976332 RepID=UPI00226CC8BC|nr:hypothetical protein [Campylobacter sp. MG1]
MKKGYRTLGGWTSDIDTAWKPLTRVRIFDRLARAAQEGVFFAVDRKLNEQYFAKQSVESLIRLLVASDVLLDSEVSFSEKNTKTTLLGRKLYLAIKTQDNPTISLI